MTLPFLTSDLLSAIPGIRHGFFTRQGGVSTGLYDSLNVGRGSDDAEERVSENRSRIAAALGTQEVKTVYQIHSAAVVDAQEAGSQADGLITSEAGCAIGILTADCVPVLLAARDGSQVAAVHAGWKGATGGILAAAAARFGGKEVVAAIGPAISQASYEVGQNVFDAASAPVHFRANGAPGKYQFDLPGLVKDKLLAAGITAIDHLENDTYSQATRFYSYRRATHFGEPDYGRQMSAILRM